MTLNWKLSWIIFSNFSVLPSSYNRIDLQKGEELQDRNTMSFPQYSCKYPFQSKAPFIKLLIMKSSEKEQLEIALSGWAWLFFVLQTRSCLSFWNVASTRHEMAEKSWRGPPHPLPGNIQERAVGSNSHLPEATRISTITPSGRPSNYSCVQGEVMEAKQSKPNVRLLI